MELDPRLVESPDLAMVKILREKTGQERLEIGFGMWGFAKKIISAGIRARHPDWTEDQVNRQVARRMFVGTS